MPRRRGRTSPRKTWAKCSPSAARSGNCSSGLSASEFLFQLVSPACPSARGPVWNCVDTASPSCYFSTAEKFFRRRIHTRRHRNPADTMSFVAKKIFLTKGVGKHRERLSSFELALRNAGIAACNIVRVSSIFPPNCKLISRSEGLKHIKPGQVAFTVISENSTKEAHRLIAASIGLALPSDKSMYGYLSEHHSFGETEEVAGEYAEELAAEMLATTLNVEFDPDLSFSVVASISAPR